MQLLPAFVISRILYSVPCVYLGKYDAEKVEAIIHKVIRKALSLPVATSNAGSSEHLSGAQGKPP